MILQKNLVEGYLDALDFDPKEFLKENKNITIKDYNKSMDIIYNSLEQCGIKRTYITKKAKNIVDKSYKNNKLDIDTLKKELQSERQNLIEEAEKISVKNIIIGIALSFFIALIHEMTLVILFYIFSLKYDKNTSIDNAITLRDNVFGPMVEEYAKFLSIRHKFDKNFMLAFNLFEFTNYIIRFSNSGMKLWKVMLMRSITVVAHYIMYSIQKYFSNEEEDRNPHVGLIIASLFHISWNTFMPLVIKPILPWVEK